MGTSSTLFWRRHEETKLLLQISWVRTFGQFCELVLLSFMFYKCFIAKTYGKTHFKGLN